MANVEQSTCSWNNVSWPECFNKQTNKYEKVMEPVTDES